MWANIAFVCDMAWLSGCLCCEWLLSAWRWHILPRGKGCVQQRFLCFECSQSVRHKWLKSTEIHFFLVFFSKASGFFILLRYMYVGVRVFNVLTFFWLHLFFSDKLFDCCFGMTDRPTHWTSSGCCLSDWLIGWLFFVVVVFVRLAFVSRDLHEITLIFS